jgi:hypothetical protein
VVIYPFIHGATMEKDFDSTLCGIMDMFANFDNIFGLMLKCLIDFGGLNLKDLLGKLLGKLVNIGYDNSNMFQGHKTRVIQ